MLGSCSPIAQAALGAATRPLRHLARHWAGHGVGRGAHHASIHHAALPHIAAPHAAGPAIMCTKMPGSLPAGRLSGAAASPAGSGAFARPGHGLTNSSYAAGAGGVGVASSAAFAGTSASATGVGGAVFGGSGLAGAALPLTAAALIATGLVAGVMAKPYQSSFLKQKTFQPAVMTSMAPQVMPNPTSTVFSTATTFPGTMAMLATTSQPGMALPELPKQMPEMPAPSTGPGAEAVPEPASLDLLSFCVLGIVLAREWGRASQR